MSAATCEFVSSQALAIVRNMLSSGSPAILAVAYWGDGATEQLGLHRPEVKTSRVQIYCDLMSGACNVNEIEKLIATGFSVKAVDRLHAKVYWTSQATVVGSANASTNGLGGDQKEQSINLEASILVRDPATIKATRVWLKTEIEPRSREITAEMLRKARALSKKLRERRSSYDRSLSELLASPDELSGRNWQVWYYAHGELSQPAERVLNEVRQEYGRGITGWELSGVSATPGLWVIEWGVGTRGPRFEGIYKHHVDVKPLKIAGKWKLHPATRHASLDGVEVDKPALHIIKQFILAKYSKLRSPDQSASLEEIGRWWVAARR